MEIIRFTLQIAIAVLLLGGVGIVVCAAKLQKQRDNPGHISWTLLRILGGGEVIVGVLAFHVGIGVLLAGIIDSSFAVDVFEIVLSAMTVAIFCVPFGVTTVRIGRFRGQHLHADNSALFERSRRRVSMQGWLLVLVIGMLVAIPSLARLISDFFPVSVVLGIAAIVAFVALLVMTSVANRRANQSELLWILSIAVGRNMPLPREVEMYAETVNRFGTKRTHRRLILLAEALRTGYGLAAALNKFPGLVPRSTIIAARIGEETGTLATMLREAAIQHTTVTPRAVLGDSVSSFIAYYTVVYSMVLFLVSFQVIFIVPKIKRIFHDSNVELPDSTMLLVEMSDHITKYFYLWLPILMLPVVIVAMGMYGQHRGWDNLAAGWMRFIPRFDTPTILRYIRRLVLSDYPLPRGFALMSQHHPRMHVRERISRVQDDMLVGVDWSLCLFEEGLLKDHERQTLASAQNLGNLPWALEAVADNIERGLRYRFAYYFELARPLIVFVLAALVGFVLIALFTPIVKLINDLT